MIALITSDTHTRDAGLYELKEKYKDQVDLWIHCGDSELEPDDPALINFHVVAGNTDWPGKFPAILKMKFDDLNLIVTHGDHYNVGWSLDYLYNLAYEEQADIVFYGHTHIAKVSQRDHIYFINPGSLHFPRGDYRQGSYALLKRINQKTTIQFYNEAHELIENWDQELVFE